MRPAAPLAALKHKEGATNKKLADAARAAVHLRAEQSQPAG
jgi:hypothetical protein